MNSPKQTTGSVPPAPRPVLRDFDSTTGRSASFSAPASSSWGLQSASADCRKRGIIAPVANTRIPPIWAQDGSFGDNQPVTAKPAFLPGNRRGKRVYSLQNKQ